MNYPARMSYEGWVVSTATIQGCDWEDASKQGPNTLFCGYFTVGYSYVVDGCPCFGKFHSSRSWETGTILGMLYNPEMPEESCICDTEPSGHVTALLEMIDLNL